MILASAKPSDLVGVRVGYDGTRKVAVCFTHAWQHSILVDLLKDFELRYPARGLRTVFVVPPGRESKPKGLKSPIPLLDLQDRIEKALKKTNSVYCTEGVVVTSRGNQGVVVSFDRPWQRVPIEEALKEFRVRGSRAGGFSLLVTSSKAPGPLARRVAALEARVTELEKGKAPETSLTGKPIDELVFDRRTFEDLISTIEPRLGASDAILDVLDRRLVQNVEFLLHLNRLVFPFLKNGVFSRRAVAETLVVVCRPDLVQRFTGKP